jgi:glyoxylase-like metal-dependent hydrolase (beta-lactamase superfamily II)
VLIQVAEGVLVNQSNFLQTNAVVAQGRAGVLPIDPGVRGDEMTCLANDLRELGQPVVAGISTHPHWDHLLWHASLGTAPRYGTARRAATVRDRLSDAGAKARIAGMIPPDIVEQEASVRRLGVSVYRVACRHARRSSVRGRQLR